MPVNNRATQFLVNQPANQFNINTRHYDWFYCASNGRYVPIEDVLVSSSETALLQASKVVRDCPSSGSRILYNVYLGTSIDVIDNVSVPGWMLISTANGTGWTETGNILWARAD